MTERTIHVGALARVEGEGALHVRLRGREVEAVEFRIFEPPRYFEALLRGRDAAEAPDITSRICGICPIAYIMSACAAMEAAAGARIPQPIRDLRRLIYCGEWIQSHVLHAVMLHAPDFLGLDDAFLMARERPETVRTALRLKKFGNALMEAIGGRAVHPVNTRLGGFYRAPAPETLLALLAEADWAAGAARALALDFAAFDFPEDAADHVFVSLIHPDHYPIEDGRIGSSTGLDIAVSEFDAHFTETQEARSTALHGRMRDGRAYLTGPLARWANNFDRLSETAKATAREASLGPVVGNPFKSILVRLIEVQYAAEEAARLIRAYRPPDPCFVPVAARNATGHGCTEAPRGICHHGYRLGADGRIERARIVPPTSQNQPSIEADLARVVAANIDLSDEALQWRCEQTIRNHDPCISCATHFLKLTVERG